MPGPFTFTTEAGAAASKQTGAHAHNATIGERTHAQQSKWGSSKHKHAQSQVRGTSRARIQWEAAAVGNGKHMHMHKGPHPITGEN
jgi:hypothetical protein